MNVDELAEQLSRAAASIELRRGSLYDTRVAGRRRRYRRRRAGVALVAGATIGGTAFGVHHLSRPRPSVSSTDVSTPGSTPASSVAPPLSNGLVATEVASPFVWRRVDPESAAAVAHSYDAGYRSPFPAVPGVMVSTGPGARDDRRTLWRTDDGISWAPTGPLPTGATAAASWTSGERVYVVGTMPGASADTVGPVRVSISDDAGGSWRGVDLPTENPALEAVAGGRAIRTGVGGVAATSQFGMVLLRQTVDPAGYMELVDELDLAGRAVGYSSEGIQIRTCPDEPVTTAPDGTGVCEEDAVDLIPWSDMGEAGRTLEAMARPHQRLYLTVDGVTFSEIAVPGDARFGQPVTIYAIGEGVVVAREPSHDRREPALWRTTDGTTWNEIPAPPGWSGALRSLGDGLVGIPNDGTFAIDLDPDGGGWRRVDLTTLLRDGEALGQIAPHAASSSGITLAASFGRAGETPAAATAPSASTPPVSADAALATTTTVEDLAPGSTAPGAAPVSDLRFEILHSADGVSWSRESVAALAGVAESEVSRISRIQTTPDGGLVVAVNLRTDATDELPHQVVLVGTPRG